MLTDELKPCPFCGMQPEDPDVGDYFVECPRCGVQGPVGNEDGRPIAKAEWNRRAIEAEVRAEVCSAQNAEYAPQDCLSLTDATQVRAEAQPVAYVMTEEEQSRTTLKTPIIVLGNLPRGANLFASQQLPAPCPQCAQHEIDFALEHDDKLELQAKVAKQSAEIARLTKERDEYNAAWQRAGEEYRKLRDSILSLAGEFK